MRPPSASACASSAVVRQPPPRAAPRQPARAPRPLPRPARAVPPRPQPQPQPPLLLPPLALDERYEVARAEVAIRLRADGRGVTGGGRGSDHHDAAVAAFSDEEIGRAAFTDAVAGLALLLGLDPAAALPLARAQPCLLALPRATLAARLMALRAALPRGVDTAAVAVRGPFLLSSPDPGPAVAAALAQLRALMPGVPVDARLAQAALNGGSLWLSFADLSREALRRR
jgi:hypothetical protein